MKIFAVFFLSLSLTGSSYGAQLQPVLDNESIVYALEKATVLSGLPALENSKIPALFWISKADIPQIVCPDEPSSCNNLAAVFDDIEYRILIRDDFDLQKSFDISFLIHEFVHALQYNKNGPEIFHGCNALLATETQAYRTQDLFLKNEGEFFRASIALRNFYCDPATNQADYLKGLAVWKKRENSLGIR